MTARYDSLRALAVDMAYGEMSLNVREIGGENRGPRVDLYERVSLVRPNADPSVAGRDWCGMFVFYCFRRASRFLNLPLPFHADVDLWSGDKLVRWARAHPESLVANMSEVQPGDIYVARNFHIGLAVSASENHSTFMAIDGNQSTGDSGRNALTLNSRNIAGCVAIVRI